jgi:hypothetical protein
MIMCVGEKLQDILGAVKRTEHYIPSFNSRTAPWQTNLEANVSYSETLNVTCSLVGPGWPFALLALAYEVASDAELFIYRFLCCSRGHGSHLDPGP